MARDFTLGDDNDGEKEKKKKSDHMYKENEAEKAGR
jgi:hypothetical protein